MDYKELIELSKKAAEEWKGTHEYYQAAILIASLCDALETTLAEREALMAQIHGECRLCSNVRKCYTDDKMMKDCARNDRRSWEWRSLTPPDQKPKGDD